jgi:RNA polymerase subunit RPABC4/transcription elongation factor Spt4
MKRKLCKRDKLFYTEEVCPRCHSGDVATSYQGRINVIDASKSEVAKKANIHENGEYAIKCR